MTDSTTFVLAVVLAAPIPAQEPAPRPAVNPTGTEWRAFRGTDGRATTTTKAPLTWSDTAHVAWKLELPGPGTSSPILVGDSVFVTCWSGYGLDRKAPGDIEKLRRHVLRVGRETGGIEWTRTVKPVRSEDTFDGRMATHGYASSTPVSDGKLVFVFFGKAGVFAFRLDGEQLWRANVGTGSSKWKTGSGSSPALWRDLLFVNASDESGSLRALHKNTGKEVWKRSSKEFDQAYGTPIVAGDGDDAVLLFGMLGELWGLDPRTGATVWSVKTKTNGALAPSIIVGADTMYSFGGQVGVRSHAVRLGGKGDVTETHVKWSTRYGSYVTTPLLHDGHLYWVNEGGIVYCADAKTGELAYKERLNGTFYSSPVRAGDSIYYVSRGEGTYVVPAKPKFEILHHNRIETDESDFDGTPAVGGGRLFLRSRKYLYCIAD